MRNIVAILLFMLVAAYGCSQQIPKNMNDDDTYQKLTPEEKRVIVNKGTEKPFTGIFENFYEEGTYICKQCEAALYISDSKFKSGCGWPSFDDEIKGAVKHIPDADGRRTEIVCANCDGHLGHIFTGEGFTDKNVRHCVNSVSLDFVPDAPVNATSDTAIFAGGCFWGVEYYMQQKEGVISTDVGYIGGNSKNPTYKEVSSHTTEFAEAVRIVFDPSKTSFEELAKLFFEIHDPTQVNRQGPDVGIQYRSEVFYMNLDQKATTEKLITQLKQKGYEVATKLSHARKFWLAEDYHQDYYEHKGSTPYCHTYTQRF